MLFFHKRLMHGFFDRRAILSLLIVLSGCVEEASFQKKSGQYLFDPIFRPIIYDLKNNTQLHVALPEKFPNIGQDKQPVRAWISEVSNQKYTIVISFHGAVATLCSPNRGLEAAISQPCRVATLSADKAPMPLCEVNLSVRLLANLHGCYFSAPVGANVGDSQVVWTDNGIQYSVSIKGGAKEEVLLLANEVIKNRNMMP